MKIISLSANIAGPACAIACSIKQKFYNNNYVTNMFDYLEISLTSIIQILLLKSGDINYLHLNNEFLKNKNDKTSVKFLNFNNIISHHDLNDNFTDNDYNNFIEKYKRRYYRLINDIKNENKIFFIRYGIEDINTINLFINTVKNLNPNLNFYFINIINDKTYNNIYIDYENYYLINYYNPSQIDEDLFYKTLKYDWKNVYDYIYKKLFDYEKDNINYIE